MRIALARIAPIVTGPVLLAFFIDVVLGAVLGYLGGLFGVGGGMIAIPALVLIYGYDQKLAQGTALVMVAPNVLMGFLRYWRRGGIDLRFAAVLAAGSVILTFFAARFAIMWHSEQLALGFAIFLIAMALWLITRLVVSKQPVAIRPARIAWPWAGAVGALGGILSGLFGVGGAIIVPPILTAWFGLAQTAAQGLALAMVAPGSVVGLATYAHGGVVDWHVGIPMAIGGIATVSYGVRTAHYLPERRLRMLFAGFLILIALVMLRGLIFTK